MQASRPRAAQQILVLGMHRSGTSALTRLLSLMGAWLGDDADLLPPHPVDNPTGYWERRDILIAQDGFLDAAGYAWDRVADFDLDSVDESLKQRLQAELASIVAHFDATGKVLTVKDPRLCLLLPIWQRVLDDPMFVVAVRDPREVAASMQNSHRGVYTTHFLLALWEKYLRCALEALRGENVLFVSYARLLADPPAESARLLAAFRAAGIKGIHAPSQEKIDAFFDRNLHRSEVQPHAVLTPSQEALFDWLAEQARAAGSVEVVDFPEGSSLDPVLREFEETAAHQGGENADSGPVTERLMRIEARMAIGEKRIADEVAALLAGEGLTGAMDDMRHRIAQIESALIDERARFTEEIASQQQDLGLVEAERANLALQCEELHKESVRLASESNAMRARNRALTNRATALEQRSAALRASFSWRITSPLRWFADLLSLRLPRSFEGMLFSIYYAIPGLTDERKRRTVLWFHNHVPWLTRHSLSYRLLEQQRKLDSVRTRSQRMDAAQAEKFLATLGKPLPISIVMPIYNAESSLLLAAAQSVIRQFYPHWELCIADDASTHTDTREALEELEKLGDDRISIRRLARHQGRPGTANTALQMATGEFVGFLAQDGLLARDALLEMARAISLGGADLIYSDEDRISADGNHHDPAFKPDFSPDLLLSTNYVGHFTVIRRALIEAVGGFQSIHEGVEEYDLILRATEKAQGIHHVPLVLYHVCASVDPADNTVANRDVAEANWGALTAALVRRDIDASLEPGPLPGTWHVRRAIKGNPLVSILVPFRDNPELLASCADSILDKTRYQNWEFVGIDNGSVKPETRDLMHTLEQRDSRIRFVRHDIPFNYSAIINFGASQSRGEHLLLLNDDTEVISDDWLDALLEHSQRPEVGVVGAKLLYPDGTFQHGGVIVGIGGVAGHAHFKLPGTSIGYCARAQIIQNVSAVTFACAMMRRDVFEELGGLNEQDLTIGYNDIDFCLRAREAGYLVVYTPCAVLYHHESKTRGLDTKSSEKQARYEAEIRYMQQHHAALLGKGDPYYNVNLSLMRDFQPGVNYVAELPQ